MTDRYELIKGPLYPKFSPVHPGSKATVKKASCWTCGKITLECEDVNGKIHKLRVSKNSLINAVNDNKPNTLKKSFWGLGGPSNKKIREAVKEVFVNQTKVNNTTILPNRGKHVGALGARWDFTSDHIPIGGSIKAGNQTVNVGVFNVLNTAFLHHITKNQQGLKGSAITTKKQRDNENINIAVSLLKNGRDYLALAECSASFEKELRNKLKGTDFSVIKSGSGNDRQLYIYNKRKLTYQSPLEVKQLGIDPNKKITRTKFSDASGNLYTFVGVHLPGGSDGPAAREQLGNYLAANYDSKRITVVMGDMNATSNDVGKAIDDAFKKARKSNPFQHLTQGTPTHIGVDQHSKDYDSIHIAAPSHVKFNENKPDTLLPGLSKIASLLS